MSSTSQIHHAAMSEDQVAEMLSNMKSSRETGALRARLPAQLGQFASNISIVKPTQTVRISPNNGAHGCCCTVIERKISMSITVAPASARPSPQQSQDQNPQSQGSEESHSKPLKLIWQDWMTRSVYITGLAVSHMSSISLRYGKHSKPVKAYTGWYDDPGGSETVLSHGRIKSVVEEVVRDMGFHEGELDNEVEVIEALLGDDGNQMLDGYAEDGPTLRRIIEHELEQRESYR